MTLPTGFAPRSTAATLRRAARLLAPAGDPVVLDAPGDGWLAAGLQVAGHAPSARPGVDATACDRALARLGLGALGEGLPPPPPGAPLVTILICTYNRAALLPEALASARAQAQHWPVEIVVVDDGSADETPALLAAAPGIRALRQRPNQGKPAALNRGLAAARGEAVLVLDDDDALLPGAVAALAHALFASPDAAAVLGDSVCFSGAPRRAVRVQSALRLPPGPLARGLLCQVPALPGATLVRMSAQRAAGAYEPSLNMLEDMDMFLRLSDVGPLRTLPLPVHLYRLHDGARGGALDALSAADGGAAFHQARVDRARPVFRDRWRAHHPAPDRATGFAWALGLKLRGLDAEAVEAAQAWPPPFSLGEGRVRRRVGLGAGPTRVRGHALVVHDGDEGSLGACLDGLPGGLAVTVLSPVARSVEAGVDVAWSAHHVGDDAIHPHLAPPGPWWLRLSSAPDWSPSPLSDPALVPPLTGPRAAEQAVRATALALGWPMPVATRPCRPPATAPLLALLRDARAREDAGDAAGALARLPPLLRALPRWKAGWRLAARLAAALGQTDNAAAFGRRGA